MRKSIFASIIPSPVVSVTMIAFLALFSGCSSTGTNVAAEKSYQTENSASMEEMQHRPPSVGVATSVSTSPAERPVKEPPAREQVPREQPVKEPTRMVIREKPLIPIVQAPSNRDEDEDISTLFAPGYLRKFDIPIVFNDAVKYYVGWFTTEKRKVFGNWLKRARHYVPIIKEILKEHGMPEDLVYLAMIESGFNPKAYSTAKACGPWQFIYATGDRYGLKVNNWIDERRDPEKSTVAAAKYLKDLFNQFGCWYLAAAGYNAGERRVERAIEKHNTNDFWELSRYNALPRETQEYIPKLIAAAIIAKDPEKFGFGSITYDAPVRFLEIKVPRATPLWLIAKAASIDVDEVKALNPEVTRGVTPPDVAAYRIKLPYNTRKTEFAGILEDVLSSNRKVLSVVDYKVKRGDTVARILKRYKLKPEEFAMVNDCDVDVKVKPGTMLQIPRFAGLPKNMEQASTKAEGEKPVAKVEPTEKKIKKGKEKQEESGKDVSEARVAKQETRGKESKAEKTATQTTYHVVKKGETLVTISDRYGIEVADLRVQNRLKNDKVYPNMKLKLVSHTQKKALVKYHVVKKGETLSMISEKYNVDLATLKSVNKLKSDRVTSNKRLKVPADAG